MNEPRQALLCRLCEGGCYLLCLVWLAERETGLRIDAVEQYVEAMRRGWCREDCYLEEPARIFSAMTGWLWAVHKEGPGYVPETGELEVVRYERPTPGRIWTHFVVGDGAGGVAYDPLGGSRTVAEGQLVSKRILRRVA